MMRRLAVLVLVPFAGCNCDEVLGGLPAPIAILAAGNDETPPLEYVTVALPPVALNTTAPLELVLRNDGNADLVVSDVVLAADPALCPTVSASFQITDPPAPAPRTFTVKQANTAPIRLGFTPTSGQPSCAIVEVHSNDAVSPVLRALVTGQGDAPQLCADRAIVDFGEVFVGETKDDSVKVTSCGTRPVTITATSTNAQFPDPFTADAIATGSPLAPGESVDIPVHFAPLVVGSWSVGNGTSGTISLTTDATQATEYRIDLVGTSRRPPACVIQVVPGVVQFGSVGEGRSSTQTVFVKNIGELDCTFTSADIRAPAGSFSRVLVDLAGGTVLGPQQSGTIEVTFAPTTIGGVENGFLDVVSSDPVAPTIEVPLEGQSVEVTPCFLEATPTAVNFGVQAVNRSEERVVTLTNVGEEACLWRGTDLINGAPEFGVLEPPLPLGAVPAGGTMDVVTSFRPTSPGNKTGLVRVTYKLFGFGNPDQTLDIPLSGQAASPCILVSPLDVDYGSVAVNATADRDVSISNCGGVDLVIRGINLRSGTHPDFRIQSSPVVPLAIPAGAQQIVTVRAAPTNAGITNAGAAMFGALEVLSDLPPEIVNLRANSAACNQGIVCQPQQLSFGEVNVGESLVRSLICSNPGTSAIAIAPTTDAPFEIVSAPASIAPGQQGVVRVKYTAGGTGADNGVVDLGANNCAGATLTVNVNGTGVDDALPPCPTPQSFSPENTWEWDGSSVNPESSQVWVTPLVSRLEDTTGDGVVTREDMPRVIFVTFNHDDFPSAISGGADMANIDHANDAMPGILRAIDGATGDEVWSASDPAHRLNSSVTPAIIDLDGDGCVEIIASKFVQLPGVEVIPNGPKIAGKFARGNMLAFDCRGNFKWESDEWTRSTQELEDMSGPAVGDVDGDGFAEIALGDHLFDHNGRLLWRGGKGTGSAGHGPMSVLVDVDGQPGLELVAGYTVYRANGTVLWDRSGDITFDGMPAVSDLDNDGDNEVVLRGGDVYVLNGQTGATIEGPLQPPTSQAMGTICAPTTGDTNEDECNIIPTNAAIMDVDGDGDLEIAIASEEILICYEEDLTERWRGDIFDGTGASGPVAFDFEADGTDNVVYSDEGNVWSWGQSGNTIYEASRQSVTLFEYASVADVDLDGHANILVGSNDPYFGLGDGLDAWQNTGTSWAHARAIWNQHAYVEALVSELGTPLPYVGPLDGFRTASPQCVD